MVSPFHYTSSRGLSPPSGKPRKISLRRTLNTFRRITRWDFCRMMEERPTTSVTVCINTDRSKHIAHLVPDWSNFEIGDLDFWRGEAYSKYFEYLESKGGFYYEVCIHFPLCPTERALMHCQRWGDAPVHSIAVSLFARKDQIHFFNEIGYRHEPFEHCPQGVAHKAGKCGCDMKDNFDYQGFVLAFHCSRTWFLMFRSYSCTYRYDRLFNS
jgi:hypothetical protein